MNRSKGMGLLVALVCALGMSGSAMAETVGTSITLLDGKGCSATLSEGTLNFGTFRWVGASGSYVLEESSEPEVFTVSASNDSYGSDNSCQVTVVAGGLKEIERGETIPDVVTLSAQEMSGPSITISVDPTAPVEVSASLASGFIDTLDGHAPGIYMGEITVTGASASD